MAAATCKATGCAVSAECKAEELVGEVVRNKLEENDMKLAKMDLECTCGGGLGKR